MKKNKKLKIFLATIMSLMMVLGTVSTAFATTVDEADDQKETNTKLQTSAITRDTTITDTTSDYINVKDTVNILTYFELNRLTSLPSSDITFKYSYVKVDSDYPDIKINDATLDVSDAVAANVSDTTLKRYSVTPTITFNVTDGTSVMPSAGTYKYVIYQTAPTGMGSATNQIAEDTNSSTAETFTPSTEAYLVRLYVANDSDGNPEIKNVTASKVTYDSTSDTYSEPDPNSSSKVESISFTNYYAKTRDNSTPDTPDDTKDALIVEKNVTGTGDVGNISSDAHFQYTMTLGLDTVTARTESVTEKTYSAKIWGKDSSDKYTKMYNYDTTTRTLTEVTDADKHTSIAFTTGTPVNFSLMSGTKLVFDELPVGTTYTLQENDVTGLTDTQRTTQKIQLGYIPGYSYSQGATGFNTSYKATTENSELKATKVATGGSLETGDDATTFMVADPTASANTVNGVVYENDYSTSSALTGLLIENLPFIIMGLVVLAGAALVIASRRRFNRG